MADPTASADETAPPVDCATRPVLRLLADDLTGALDTAARFVGLVGVVPTVWTHEAIPAGSCAIDSGTRERDAASARAVVASLAPALAAGEIAFKKIDSLLRGHLVPELRACLDARSPDGLLFAHTILAPAFPFQGRITRRSRTWLRDGADWREIAFDHAALPVPMHDAETDADLDRIVTVGRRLAGRVLWCGTAGLAGALAVRRAVPAPALRGPVLALIGSDHAVTQNQIAAWRESASARAAIDLRTILLWTGIDRDSARRLIATGFEAQLATAARPGVLFVSGGETLRAVCTSLGGTRLDVDGELEPGVPTSLLRGGRWDGQRVVSKSGAFGDAGFLIRLAELVSTAASA
jgi:uncharacterized protein YgbK (DUF1537 family)